MADHTSDHMVIGEISRRRIAEEEAAAEAERAATKKTRKKGEPDQPAAPETTEEVTP